MQRSKDRQDTDQFYESKYLTLGQHLNSKIRDLCYMTKQTKNNHHHIRCNRNHCRNRRNRCRSNRILHNHRTHRRSHLDRNLRRSRLRNPVPSHLDLQNRVHGLLGRLYLLVPSFRRAFRPCHPIWVSPFSRPPLIRVQN